MIPLFPRNDPVVPGSYALQTRYDDLIRRIGRVTARDIELAMEKFTLAGDPRDVLKARDSLMGVLARSEQERK
jgi:hypothetical protein